eukprot:15432604-Alexandrium_andersonii.AAC.3
MAADGHSHSPSHGQTSHRGCATAATCRNVRYWRLDCRPLSKHVHWRWNCLHGDAMGDARCPKLFAPVGLNVFRRIQRLCNTTTLVNVNDTGTPISRAGISVDAQDRHMGECNIVNGHINQRLPNLTLCPNPQPVEWHMRLRDAVEEGVR